MLLTLIILQGVRSADSAQHGLPAAPTPIVVPAHAPTRLDSVAVVSLPIDPDAHALVTWTVVLGLGTAGLALASFITIGFLRAQGKDLKAQHVTAQEQARYLSAQADHLKAAVDGQQAHSLAELRAYVGVQLTRADHPSAWLDHIVQMDVEVTNTGRTPAIDMTMAFDMYPLEKTVDIRNRLPLTDGQRPSRGTLGIGDTTHCYLKGGAPVPDENLYGYDEGTEYAWFVYGTVRYVDAIQQRPHYTNFCRRVQWKNGTAVITALDYGNDFT